MEAKRAIPVCSNMHELEFSANYSNFVGRVLLYNPDKWECSEYYFFKSLPVNSSVLKERYVISEYYEWNAQRGVFQNNTYKQGFGNYR